MKNDECWRMNDEGWWFQAVEGFLWLTDKRMNKQTFVNIESLLRLKSNIYSSIAWFWQNPFWHFSRKKEYYFPVLILQLLSFSACFEMILLQEDSIIVVLGSGLSEWLLDGRSSGFHAASHAVKSVKDDSITRSVMARMKVVNDVIFCFL